MKVKRYLIPEVKIQDFAEEHNLVLEVHERRNPIVRRNAGKYYCHFQNAEVLDDPVLIGEYGNGKTEEQALANYAERISYQTLVIDACGKKRREIEVPKLKV